MNIQGFSLTADDKEQKKKKKGRREKWMKPSIREFKGAKISLYCVPSWLNNWPVSFIFVSVLQLGGKLLSYVVFIP